MTRLFVGLVLLGTAVGAWVAREPILGAAGKLVVEESPLSRADLVVVMGNSPRIAAEAAAIVRAHYAAQVVLFPAPPRADDDIVRRLNIEVAAEHEVALRVLRASGVPAPRIELMAHAPDGTNEAVRAVVLYARRHGMTRVIAVTERSHTRRTARLLRRELPGPGAVMVRASPRDDFHPETWWRDRASARELAMESLRWWNSFGLRDWWKTTPGRATGARRGRPANLVNPSSVRRRALRER
jgi:uncharacterized SAM-binding protein YcdF (DUF218 family)